MARTLYMNDGSTEVLHGDPKSALQKIIYERLGLDAEELFEEITSEKSHLEQLEETRKELRDVLVAFRAPRLNRDMVKRQIETIVMELQRYIHDV